MEIPQAVILTIGSEILFGDLLDTNASWLARSLVELCIEPVAHETVGDRRQGLVESLKRCLKKADLVVTTGGLGPTPDDITRQAVAEATGRPLGLRQDLLGTIARRLAERGRTLEEGHRQQAFLPEGAEALPNPVGTAPGFALSTDEGAFLVCLPGVPFEMEQMWAESARPLVRRRFPPRGAIVVRVLKCVGAGESDIQRLLGEIAEGTTTAAVTFQLSAGEVHLRLLSQGPTEAAARHSLNMLEAKVCRRLGRLLYGKDDDTLPAVTIRALQERAERLAVVEGATAGVLTRSLAREDPRGRTFVQSIVAPEEGLWKALGAEVPEPSDPERRSVELARWAASRAGISLGLASSGILFADQEEARGTFFLAAVWGKDERKATLQTAGPLELVQQRAALAALDLLRRFLYGWPEAGA